MEHGALNSFLQDREGQLSETTLVDMARQAAAGMKYLGKKRGKIYVYIKQKQIMLYIVIWH